MLEAVPRAWFSWDFSILDEAGSRIASVDMSAWRERASFMVGDTTYRIRRDGIASGPFFLEREGGVLGRAIKPSAFRNSFTIECAGRNYELRKRSAFGREYVLEEDARKVGHMTPRTWFGRQATVDFPDALSVPMQVFLAVLVLFLWKRDSDAAAAAGGG